MSYIDKDGYVRNSAGDLEHVLVAEKAHGSPLPAGAVVHHKDGNRRNNSPENLMICRDAAHHQWIHAQERAQRECGHADWRKCVYCHKYDDPENMTRVPTNQASYHKACAAKYQRELRARKSSLSTA